MREIDEVSYDVANSIQELCDLLDLDNREIIEATLAVLLGTLDAYEVEHPGAVKQVKVDLDYYLNGLIAGHHMIDLANERGIDMGIDIMNRDPDESFIIVGGDSDEDTDGEQ
jgi:hypothetical protein